MTLPLFAPIGAWEKVTRCDPMARDLADQHYSRQTIGARDFTPPGRTLVLRTPEGGAVWAVVENLDPAGGRRWRNTIFRNTRPDLWLSSALIVEATITTRAFWLSRFGALPAVPLTTEIDPNKVRRKRDPGRCYIRAGWRRVADARGLVVLEATFATPSSTSVGSSKVVDRSEEPVPVDEPWDAVDAALEPGR